MNWPPRHDTHTPDKTGKPDEPWLTRDAITFLEKTLHGGQRVLEYGCGASTIWFSKRAISVDSVEHDRPWFDKVVLALQQERVQNVGLHHVPWDNDYEDYVQAGRILGLKNRGFDLVVVDGRRRVRCVKAIAEFVAPDGYLILDNAERENYAEAHEFLKSWFVKRTTNGIWRTDIFRR